MHSEWVELGGLAISIAVGLFVGQRVWAFRTAWLSHNPSCPAKQEVLDEAKRVQLDIDQLVTGSR